MNIPDQYGVQYTIYGYLNQFLDKKQSDQIGKPVQLLEILFLWQ